MAYRTAAELSTLFANNEVLTNAILEDLFDSFERKKRRAEIDGPETTIFVVYEGDTAPTFTSPSAGVYVLTVPSGVELVSFFWDGTDVTLNSGNVTLRVKSTDTSKTFRPIIEPYGTSTGKVVDQLDNVTKFYSYPSAGECDILITNIASISGELQVIGKI